MLRMVTAFNILTIPETKPEKGASAQQEGGGSSDLGAFQHVESKVDVIPSEVFQEETGN